MCLVKCMEEATRHSFNVEPMHCVQNNDHFGHTKVSLYKNPPPPSAVLDVVDSNMVDPTALFQGL